MGFPAPGLTLVLAHTVLYFCFHLSPQKVASMTDEKMPASRHGAERRTHPRYGFNADAEVTEDASGAKIEGRITDISQQGCYVENTRSFPLGTAIKVRIIKGGES